MTLSANIQSLAIRVATELKTSRTVTDSIRGDLTALEGLVDDLGAAEGGATINDGATSASSVWSSSKTSGEITAAVNALVADAPEALDTLKELADALGDADDALDGVLSQIASVGDTSANFVTAFEGALA